MSPRFFQRNSDPAGFGNSVGDDALEFVVNGRRLDTGTFPRHGPHPFDLSRLAQHNPHCVTFATFRGEAPFAMATVGDRADPGLEQLVGRNPEETRHGIEVDNLHIPLAAQDLVDPRLIVVEPTRELGIGHALHPKQGLDVLPQDDLGVHFLGKTLFHNKVGARPSREAGWPLTTVAPAPTLYGMMSGRDRLAQWLERSKLTQRELAVLLEMHYTHVNQILSGRRTPGLDNAVKIERATGIPAEAWLATDVGSLPNDDPQTTGNAVVDKA